MATITNEWLQIPFSSWVYQNADMSEIDCRIRCFAKATYQPCDKIDPSSCNLDSVYAICKDKSPGSECYKGTTEEVVILKQTDNHKYPDAALTEATKPLITVEVGITQSLESLFCDCRSYLRDDSRQIARGSCWVGGSLEMNAAIGNEKMKRFLDISGHIIRDKQAQ